MCERDIWVDFNDADEQGVVSTLVKFVEPNATVRVGGYLLAGDNDGNACVGVVESLVDDLVTLRLCIATFHNHDDPA